HTVWLDVPLRVFDEQERTAIKRHLDDMPLLRYGTNAPLERAEIVSLRTTVTGIMRKPVLDEIAGGGAAPSRAARTGKRPVYFDGHGFVDTRTFGRGALAGGNRIKGPALIEEHASTTVLMPGDALEVDRLGNLAIAVGKRRS